MRSATSLFVLLQTLVSLHAFTSPGRPFSVSTQKASQLYATASHTTIESTSWSYEGHYIYTQTTNPSAPISNEDEKPAILLIHGFGCSTTYWRRTIQCLSEQGYQTHALDLLGQGRSAKPGRADGIQYSINLWAQIVDQYISENISRDVILMGNSLGSLVALAAKTRDFSNQEELNEHIKAICMFNCGVGLNSRGIANEGGLVKKIVVNAIYNVLDALIFSNQPLLKYVLEEIVTRELLNNALNNLYTCTPANVDEELVESFYLPAKDAGSPEALSQIYSNDPGSTPMELHSKYEDGLKRMPLHLIWGDTDVVTPLPGGVGQFYVDLSKAKDNVSFDVVSSGHIPFDDNPDASNESMVSWLEKIKDTSIV